jgi:hypothetical protein
MPNLPEHARDAAIKVLIGNMTELAAQPMESIVASGSRTEKVHRRIIKLPPET